VAAGAGVQGDYAAVLEGSYGVGVGGGVEVGCVDRLLAEAERGRWW